MLYALLVYDSLICHSSWLYKVSRFSLTRVLQTIFKIISGRNFNNIWTVKRRWSVAEQNMWKMNWKWKWMS